MSGHQVKNFYDNQGWNFEGTSTHDAILNENLTGVAANYVSKVRLRILDSLGSGDKLLDIGCGPIQYPEYVQYSTNFRKRYCVDLSAKALEIAQSRIGEHGVFICGDYLQISELEKISFDSACIINVLYHVEKDQQERLVRKMLANVRPGGKVVVVYSNPNTFSAFVVRLLVAIKRLGRRSLRLKPSGQNPIYFFRHSLSFWNTFEDLSTVEIRAWRTFSPQLEKLFFHKYFFGGGLLRLLFQLEKFSWWARFAEYPMIMLTKNDTNEKPEI